MRTKKDYRNKKRLEALFRRYSLREIGTLYGVSHNAIWKWQRRFKIEATVEDKRALEMIQDLKNVGLSYGNIAQITSIGLAQIYKIKNNKSRRPDFQTVRELKKLHRKVCKELKEE